MKIRTGFVSNSSSSSFLLMFDEMPLSPAHLIEFLPSSLNACLSEYSENPDNLSLYDYASIIFKDIQNFQNNEDFRKSYWVLDFLTDYFESINYRNNYNRNDLPTDWYDQLEKDSRKHADDEYKHLIEKYGLNNIALVHYEDHDWTGANIESGVFFKNIKHLKTNNH